ncbi:MAG TPA: carboxylating nicotinate-nucleotide diphosphorylase [Euryarchaeota archaeon]|nr:putative nicotinate-nucleotide pyrophosphorylase [carboxylating] [archaeon BMS3Abin16]GBE56360.1 putative nicotinate-nucleotide pyrophosphorylase [carboxylating] [archaeon BMS3Bbin16]HDH28723.1 carboxylating nicotinate-nucleotide diphosphorylase [Euryarchaeota archaeon]
MVEMIERLLAFLDEDLGSGDVTSESTVPTGTKAQAVIVAKDDGVVAGCGEASMLFDHFMLEYDFKKRDGERISDGEVLAEISGDARSILKVERLVLNLISRLSGVATLTDYYVSICKPCGVEIMATRKTTPGFRVFEKKAVEIGGGLRHRDGLYDGVLIKDNHLALVGLNEAIKQAKSKNHGLPVEVEVTTPEDAVKAVRLGADIIMLDNFTPDDAKGAVETLEKEGLRGQVIIELSGGINRDTVADYARAGADRISLGSLTTDARWLDYSLQILG